MAKRKEITASFYIGDQQVDKLPEEYLVKMSERVGEVTSTYYTAHPEEYRILCASDS